MAWIGKYRAEGEAALRELRAAPSAGNRQAYEMYLVCSPDTRRFLAKAARDQISAIKFSVAGTMLRAVDTAIQVHGALGVTDDTILSYWYRHERAARIYDGADEVHKTSLGRRLLRQAAQRSREA